MNRRWRSWIPGIVFWTWFLVSIALVGGYPWLDIVWNAAWMLLLLVIAGTSVVHIFRHRRETGGYIAYRGVPRWVMILFGGDYSK
jgi:hypothetical protein